MKILRIATRSFRGLPDGDYTFGDGESASPVTVVDGAPGTGKTSLLDAIACAKELVGAYGIIPPAERLLRHGAKAGRLEATWLLSESEQRFAETDSAQLTHGVDLAPGRGHPLAAPGLRRLFATHPVASPPGCGGLELFDADRALPVHGAHPPLDDEAELERRANRGSGRYDGLVRWLHQRVVADGAAALRDLERGGLVARWDRSDALADVREAVQQLDPGLQLDEVDPVAGQITFASRGGAPRALRDLADGERMKVLFAIAFRRFALDDGIALIDDVDRGLPPTGRDALLHALSQVARDVQLIVTTRVRKPPGRLPGHHRIDLGGET